MAGAGHATKRRIFQHSCEFSRAHLLLAVAICCMFCMPPSFIPSLELAPTLRRTDAPAFKRPNIDPFGSWSRVECLDEIRQTCVFSNVYLVDGQLYFLQRDDEAPHQDTVASIHLGVPLHADNPWPLVRPVPISRAEFEKIVGAHAATTPQIYESPVFLFHRLNPNNIYHHLWDDMSTVYALLQEVYSTWFSTPGSPAAITIVFTDSFGRNRHIDVWNAITTFPVQMFHEVFPKDRSVVMFRAIGAGSRGRCTHRRHCTSDMPAHFVRSFKRHMLAFYNVTAELPDMPTAVVIARQGRRILRNPDEVVAMARNLGYATHIVGPFEGTPFRDQLQAVAQASLAIFLHGAELGITWLGLPEGACASVIFPFYFTDTISWWVGEKVGIKIAPFYDAPNNNDDPRLRKKISNIDDSVALYNEDVHVTPWLLEHSIWCANPPGFATSAE